MRVRQRQGRRDENGDNASDHNSSEFTSASATAPEHVSMKPTRPRFLHLSRLAVAPAPSPRCCNRNRVFPISVTQIHDRSRKHPTSIERVGVRGSFPQLGLAEAPPHPECARTLIATSPRPAGRGEEAARQLTTIPHQR